MATLKIRCTNTQVKGSVKVSTEPNIVTFHIYNRGSIEKHIPKKITQGYENKYRYVYHIGNKRNTKSVYLSGLVQQKWHLGISLFRIKQLSSLHPKFPRIQICIPEH